MTTKPATIYVRESDGNRNYVPVKEGPGHRPKPPFYVRLWDGKRQKPVKLNAQTLGDAKIEASLGAVVEDAKKAGLTVPEMGPLVNASRTLLTTAVAKFLDKKRTRDYNTTRNYRLILGELLENTKAQFLDQLNADALDEHVRFLESKGNRYGGAAEPKTIRNRMTVICCMLKSAGVVNPWKAFGMSELPKVEEEIAEPYTKHDLRKLFAVMEPEEVVAFTFFLHTGCREREVAHAQWVDIINHKEYWVRRKSFTTSAGKEESFSPKSHETRRVPLPQDLINLLEARRKNSKSPWVFPNRYGDPEGHFLRKFKKIAKLAGLNCGGCKVTLSEGKYVKKKVDVTCKVRPICRKHYLHRLRKTCATFWHENHISIRTIQHWLGHRSLETTQKYLGVTSSDELHAQINKPRF